MQSLTRSPERVQPPMPDTPRQQVRKSIAIAVVDEIAERLLQHDKANPSYTLRDLRSDDERKVYRDAALEWLASPTGRTMRLNKIHSLRSHGFAFAESEEQQVAARARQDIERYGLRAAVVSHPVAGRCWVCSNRITPAEACVLELSATNKVDAHASCCSKDPRFELLSSFSFRLIGGAR